MNLYYTKEPFTYLLKEWSKMAYKWRDV